MMATEDSRSSSRGGGSGPRSLPGTSRPVNTAPSPASAKAGKWQSYVTPSDWGKCVTGAACSILTPGI